MANNTREQITRAEDPDHLADTEVDPPLGIVDGECQMLPCTKEAIYTGDPTPLEPYTRDGGES